MTKEEKLSAFLDGWCCDKSCREAECIGIELIFKTPPMYAWALSVVDFWNGGSPCRKKKSRKK